VQCFILEYTITTAGNTITVLINHLKSKGYGPQDSSDKKRKRQALRVRELYNSLIANGQNLMCMIASVKLEIYIPNPDSSGIIIPAFKKEDMIILPVVTEYFNFKKAAISSLKLSCLMVF
jgi:hypothetical protein